MDKAALIADIKNIGSAYSQNMSDDILSALIDKAQTIAESDGFPDTVKVKLNGKTIDILQEATEDMALHLCAVNSAQGQGILSEKVDVLSRTYASTVNSSWLGRSPWGRLYLWLYRKYGGGALPRLTVIQH